MNINEVRIAGRLTRDAQLRYTPSNTAVADFGIAINRRVKNQSTGKWEDGSPTFIDVTAWQKSAEAIAKHFKKGDRIYIAGRLDMEQWDDKQTGAKRTKLKVVVESWQFVDTASTATPAKQPASDGWDDTDDAPF